MDPTFLKNTAPDVERLKRGMLVGLLTLFSIVASFVAVRSGNMVWMGAVIGLPVLVMLLTHPVHSLYLALIMYLSSLNVLRIGSFSDASIFFSFAAFSCFFMLIFRRERYRPERGDKLFGGFLVVIFILMVVRGTGLKFMGASTWGGSPYILIMMAIFFYLFSRRLRIDGKGIKRTLWLVVLMGVVNTLMQRLGFLAETDQMSEVLQARLSWTKPAATTLLLLALVVKWKKSWITALFWVAAMGVTGLAGFRSRLVVGLMLTAAFFYFRATNRKAYVVKAALAGCLVWMMVVASSPMLPLGLQRAVSFIPGVNVSLRQAANAESSTEWRYEIWRFCMEEAPNYWLVGRGITFDVRDAAVELGIADVQGQTQWFMFFTHSYHSGPLTLLIDYGLPGLLFMLAIHILFIGKCLRMGRAFAGGDSLVSRFALFMLASILSGIISYWLLFGKTESLAILIFQMGVLHIAYHSTLELKKPEPSIMEDETVVKAFSAPSLHGKSL